MIQRIYNDMWSRFRCAIESNECEIDSHILDMPGDNRRGITALAYLNQDGSRVLNEIMNFQNEVKSLDPHQYYYPSSDIHMTILSVISCTPGFLLSDINVDSYTRIFESVFSGSGPIEVQYRGVTASPGCVVIQGFPVGDGLEVLRKNLRKEVLKSGLRSNLDTRYRIEAAHSSLIRFCKPLNNGAQLFNLCNRYRNHLFGSITFNSCELVFNNWYQSSAVTETLARCSLLSKGRV
ncbi:hypothetical protein [Marinimicrobium sp. C2-29]|uniref:hypothetical protein n=1 Tax=Marinimicrobium sp. C2-29 TaxID=3139825 RepID=UPI0031399921